MWRFADSETGAGHLNIFAIHPQMRCGRADYALACQADVSASAGAAN